MYNRYIPQPDGSYRRSRVMTREQDQKREEPVKTESCTEEPQEEHCEKQVSHSYRSARHSAHPGRHTRCRNTPKDQQGSASSFLKNLLPKNLETGDLLIILLLLLIAGDCTDDHNYALLTLAIYCFM